MFVVCCVGSGLGDELITRSEECVVSVCAGACVRSWLYVCDLETSIVRLPRPKLVCWATEKKVTKKQD